MQQRDAVVAQLAAAQPLVLGRRRARLQRLGLLDQRAHDERLAPRVELLADEVVGPRALGIGRRDVRLHRPAPARQLAQRGDVEVAVAQQRHRARDRRRRHVQDVRHEPRLRLGVQRRALAHAEAVLLVDDDDRQPVEHDVGLDQRVRPHDERQLAGRQLVQRVGAPRGRRRAGQQRRAHGLARHQRLQRREVLLGERLGRRHEDRLHVVLDGAQHRVQRDDGLARADLPHEQALHRPRRGELLVERRDRPRLVAGQLQTAAAPRASAASATARRRAPAPRRDARRWARRRSSESCASSSSSKASRRRPPS